MTPSTRRCVLLLAALLLHRALAQPATEQSTSPNEPKLVDPTTLRQYDDNRMFIIDGRRCFGSELNGQRVFDPAERKFTQSNRVINPSPINPDHPLEWQVKDEAEIYDGAGILMGTVASRVKNADGKRVPTCKFNFGMSKMIGGKLCIYAFSTPIVPSKQIADLIDHNEMDDGAVTPAQVLADFSAPPGP